MHAEKYVNRHVWTQFSVFIAFRANGDLVGAGQCSGHADSPRPTSAINGLGDDICASMAFRGHATRIVLLMCRPSKIDRT